MGHTFSCQLVRSLKTKYHKYTVDLYRKVSSCIMWARPPDRGWDTGLELWGTTHAQCNWSCGCALRLAQFRRVQTRFYRACVVPQIYDVLIMHDLSSFHPPCMWVPCGARNKLHILPPAPPEPPIKYMVAAALHSWAYRLLQYQY